MKKIFSFAVIASLFISCNKKTESERSEILHEDGIVSTTVYTPSSHSTTVGMTALKTGGFGMDYGGNMGIRLGSGLQISSVTVPEKFSVVFQCTHGKFVVEDKTVYEKLKNHEGKSVDISYYEMYQTSFKKENGKWNLEKRVLIDYDFVNAVPK